MKVTVFTSNQPRHLALINRIAAVCDQVFAIHESTTVFPGQVADFYRKSAVMQDYFGRVTAAERAVFGPIAFTPRNSRSLVLRAGDINLVQLSVLTEALEADYYIVFGASYIRPPLVDLLLERRALNIHMGVSPYYRGNSCNFWALADGNPELVGATIHLLSKGLDSGAMLFHALPQREAVDPFVFGMRAVEAAQAALVRTLADGSIRPLAPVPQDRDREIRYSRSADFTDEVAAQYLARCLTSADLAAQLAAAPRREFLRPIIS